MKLFALTGQPIDVRELRELFADPAAGAFVSFDGWVRDFNEGRAVRALEYQAYERLAEKEGARIVAEAIRETGARAACCVHRTGHLGIGEVAVWVGVSSQHRAEAFQCCRRIIDELKKRLPIWKKEFYADGDSGWVNCERCSHEPIEIAGS